MKLIIILLLALLFINLFVKCGSCEKFGLVDINNVTQEEEQYIKKTIGIPKIIIQTWKDNNIPEKYHKDIETVKNLNPGFEYLFFTDDDIEKFLSQNYPEWYKTYQKLPVKIQKIDFFRYIAVYHYGGFYFDLDITCLKPLYRLTSYDCVFPVDQHFESCENDRMKEFCGKNINYLLGQYAFGASKQNPFIHKLIDTIHQSIDKYISDYETLTHNYYVYIYKSTGPDFVTKIYTDYNNKNDVLVLYHKDAQYFGDFAKHNFYGTWK